jgi:hypothetical protein
LRKSSVLVLNERLFEVRLRVLVLEAQKLEDEWILPFFTESKRTKWDQGSGRDGAWESADSVCAFRDGGESADAVCVFGHAR